MTELAKTAAGVASESANGLLGVYEKMDREAHPERAKALLDGSNLIAAAPDMLEALRQAEGWLSEWASAEPYITEIRAAIAKATGAA